jgi:hypothetical protein
MSHQFCYADFKEVSMAHLVESMMYVGKTPWHGLGIPIPEGKKISVREAIVTAGLDWKVELRHLFTENAQRKITSGLLDYYAVCRTTDDACLGIVGPDYVPLQNEDRAELVSTFSRRW